MSAFTAVSTRRTLGGGSSAFQPPPSAPSKSKATVFPPGVKLYVQRCFASDNDIPGVTTEQMQARLKQVINEAAEHKALDTIDWESLPLPQQMIHDERRVAAIEATRPKMQDNMSDLNFQPTAASSFSSSSLSTFPPTNKPNPKKRKSSEIADDMPPVEDSATPPWRKVTPRNIFEDRITYADQAQAKRIDKKQRKFNDNSFSKDHSKSSSELEKRRQRFGTNWTADISSGPTSRDESPMPDADAGPVIGTCQTLEKKYFRLTSAPKPETVRPLHVLEQTLDLLKRKWKSDGNYSFICDQFKSLRQDLTVQHIKSAFTVNVYETHARIALEKLDMGEYNQCQTQLRALYKQKLGGHPAEFLAYRILYFIYTGNRTDMNDVLADLTMADREQSPVKHALDVRSALALGNYHRFFRLYLQTPHMGAYLMDMFVVRERLAALSNVCKAYKQIELRHLTEELGFESDAHAAAFICDHGGQEFFEPKEEVITFHCGKAGTIFETAKGAAFSRVDIKGQI